MSGSNANAGPARTARRFPLWPAVVLLCLILLLALLAGGCEQARAQLKQGLQVFRVPGWSLRYWAPSLAVIIFALGFHGRIRGFRRAITVVLLGLSLLQGFLVAKAVFGLINNRGGLSVYSSEREYLPLGARPADWPDPLQPALFELGDDVRLSMSMVCVADASGRTLPKVAAPALPQPKPDHTMRPLTATGLQNLVAFTRAMGYVRFFHPSDEGTKVYWNQVAILGVQAVEDAATPQELAQRLQSFFAPLAPTVHFLAPGETAPKLTLPAGGTQLVRWRHRGMGPLNENSAPFDRSVRLADVAITWTVMQHFYPYFDVVSSNWAAELPKALEQAAIDPDERSFLQTLRTLVAVLKDGHGNVYRTSRQTTLVVPVEVRILAGRAYVKAGPGETPKGSEILAVEGEATQARLARLRMAISAATEGWMTSRLEQRLFSGCLGPRARISIRTPGGERKDVDVALTKYSEALAYAGLPTPLAELRPGVWYVDLDRIEDKEFNTALPKLAEAKGVVFDLRGYPKMGPRFLQHLTDKPIHSARWNVPVITEPDGRHWSWSESGRWNLEPLKPRIKGRIVFLTGGGAISYAESCLGIVEAYKLAEIVGEPSAGTNGNVNPLELPGGYTVSWTGMKVLKHDGTRHHGVGILPTVPAHPTPKGLAEGRDEVLEKGLEIVVR